MDNRLFRLRLFGGAVLEDAAGPMSGRAVQRRRLALLALLATAPKQTVSRDKLIAWLWPDSDTDQARHLLSDSLYILNKSLGKDALRMVGDDVRLNVDVIWCDVVQFRDRLAANRPQEAVELYKGPFLDGVFLAELREFERWVEVERDRLARDYAMALEELAATAQRGGDAKAATNWWRLRATHDPYDSRIALALVRALATQGDRAGALQHARVHTALLREELGISPPDELAQFIETLRAHPEPTLRAPAKVRSPQTQDPYIPQAPKAKIPPALIYAIIAFLVIGGIFVQVKRRAVNAASTNRAVLFAAIEGSDSTLSLAVREALRAELEANRSIRLVSEDAVRETLRLMRQPPTTSLGLPVALDIAQRHGAPMVVTGSVARVGSGVQVVAKLVSAQGAPLATFTTRPTHDDDVLPAVARLAESIRARVLSVPVDTVSALPAVSTSSLEALRYYVRARQAAMRGEAAAAAELAEAALVHDSLFTLAHYLAADQLWYIDKNEHSNQHMIRAFELSAQLPPREKLIVRARYEQLVRDEPDSALVYWRLLARSYPDEAIAYEGMRWAYRALSNMDEMAAAAESAYHRDATQAKRYAADRTLVYLMHGDTASAFKLARNHGVIDWARAIWAEVREDWPEALRRQQRSPYKRHFILLAMGHADEAFALLDEIRRANHQQELPRALLLQARTDLFLPATRARARALLREAITWIENADLSPPTYSRYAERCADVAARLGDLTLLQRVHALIRAKDARRNLRSYRFALTTIAAARAYAHGDMAAAAGLAAQAWPGVFYGRSVGTVVLLEADARAAVGERAAADSLYRLVVEHQFIDGDGETLAVLKRQARAALSPSLQGASTRVVPASKGPKMVDLFSSRP